MKRRRAIGMLGGIVGGPLLAPPGALAELVAWAERVRASAGVRSGPGGAAAPSTATHLTPPRARVMAALAEVIIPATETPGASAAGVTDFVAALVDGWLNDDNRDRFLAGLDTVDPSARDRFGTVFADCPPAEQALLAGDLDADLTRLREDPAADETQHFFHDVKRFTLTAWFTSEVGLEAIGYRTSFRAFEGCAPLTAEESGAPPGGEGVGSPGPSPGAEGAQTAGPAPGAAPAPAWEAGP